MAKIGFNPAGVAPRDNTFELLPKGWYQFIVTDSDIKQITNGEMLKLTFECQQQGFRGRKVWGNLCIKHNSAQTQLIAQQQLKELCEAIGLQGELTDTVQLHNKPFQGHVKIRKSDNPQYPDDTNEINAFKPIGAITGGQAPAAPAGNGPAWGARPAPAPAAQEQTSAPPPAPAPAAPAPAAGGSVPPWQKR